ncbi:MAG: helix-turn-helix domain-containing protein [Nanoarchaeota archaeon]|nr:helix-turn-helix domain-containing protein [Nanoarchaeota archaeon]
MYETELVKEAGLTDGEAKVYLALLELGASTTGPIIEKSRIARSFIYNILDKLMEEGLVSYVTRENTKYYEAASPRRILDYIEKRRNQLEESKNKVENLLPQLLLLRETTPSTEIHVFEGYKGLQTAYLQYHHRLKKGDEILALGILPIQEDKYHEFWKRDHEKRDKEGIKNRMLFNRGTAKEVLQNRNSYKLCEARYMNTDIHTESWILIYSNVTQIYLQDRKKPLVIEILNQQIAETFKAYFEDYWKNTKS